MLFISYSKSSDFSQMEEKHRQFETKLNEKTEELKLKDKTIEELQEQYNRYVNFIKLHLVSVFIV